MQLVFVVLTLLAVTIAVFALQNADPVVIRFLAWERHSSVALVTLGAACTGAVIGWLLGLVARLARRRRPGPEPPAPPAPPPPPPGPPAF
jgi:uncharacterized integral membrane protein